MTWYLLIKPDNLYKVKTITDSSAFFSSSLCNNKNNSCLQVLLMHWSRLQPSDSCSTLCPQQTYLKHHETYECTINMQIGAKVFHLNSKFHQKGTMRQQPSNSSSKESSDQLENCKWPRGLSFRDRGKGGLSRSCTVERFFNNCTHQIRCFPFWIHWNQLRSLFNASHSDWHSTFRFQVKHH